MPTDRCFTSRLKGSVCAPSGLLRPKMAIRRSREETQCRKVWYYWWESASPYNKRNEHYHKALCGIIILNLRVRFGGASWDTKIKMEEGSLRKRGRENVSQGDIITPSQMGAFPCLKFWRFGFSDIPPSNHELTDLGCLCL